LTATNRRENWTAEEIMRCSQVERQGFENVAAELQRTIKQLHNKNR